MGIRGLNPLLFNSFVANQLDPALNIGGRPVARRANANSQADGDGDATRGDQIRATLMDLAAAGIQGDDTPIDESQTQLDSSRLRQEVGQRAATERGHHLDILT